MKGWAVGTNAEREDSDDLFSDVKKDHEEHRVSDV